MSVRHLDRLLAPRSVAVIGASDRASSVGATVWRNLRGGAYEGESYAVNARHDTVGGARAYARVAELPAAPDLALICTPPETVAGLVGELGGAGTRAAVVMTAGLTPAQRQAMLDAARPHVLRVLGPNCLGLLTPRLGLNASFAHTDALPGQLAFVSQSGALVTAVLDWAQSRRIGFSHLVSLGEHADVDFGDLLDFLASDAQTRSILLYIESISAPRKFMSAARAAARNKPVIVVKAGRAGRGVQAAASHTGALAGSDLVYDAAIRRAGMLRVDTLQDLFMAAETLARFRGSVGERGLTLLTNGGGAGVMAADAAALAGVPLRELGDELRAQLDGFLPATWSRANPIDIIGDAPVQRYTDTLSALLADEGTGAVLFMHAPTAIVRSADIARACAPLARQAGGHLMGCWLGDAAVAEARRVFDEAGIAGYATPEEAVRALAMMQTYKRNQALLTETPPAHAEGTPDVARANAIVESALARGAGMLDEFDAKALLAAYGIPTVPTLKVAPSADAAVGAARELGYPVVLKVVSAELSHKSDVGGVRLHIAGDAELRRAVDEMGAQVQRQRPGARISGYTVQPMVQRPRAQELLVGISVDPMFGPVVLFGQGGTATEVVADRAIGLPPLNRVLAGELVSRTRVARLLAGYRDHAPAHIDAICDVLIALSQLAADQPALAELDINPLWADESGVIALDARVRLAADAGGGAAQFAIRPYPAQLAEAFEWQGQRIIVRPVRPEDGTGHRRFLEGEDPEDLRLRFFSSRRELPRSELARLVQIDYAREMAFIAVAAAGDGSPLGVVHSVTDPDNVEAEFAIIVRSDLKRQGLGALLLQKLVRYLRAQGTQRLVADVLRENQTMRQLAIELGFRFVPTDEPSLRCEMDLQPGPAAGARSA